MLRIFEKENFKIRTLEEDGEIWIVAKDVVEALGYSEKSSTTQLMQIVPDIWKGGKRVDTRGGEQEMLCLTEQGLYFFLGRSDKPNALPYQMWVAKEVVPNIRQTGSYTLRTTSLPEALEAAKLIFKEAGLTGNQLALALDKVYQSYTGQSVLQLVKPTTQQVSPPAQQVFTPSQLGRKLRISGQKVNQILATAGYQRKRDDKTWEPLERGQPYATMLSVNKAHTGGTTTQLKWDISILDRIKEAL